MINHPSSEIARRMWEAIAEGDAETLRELFAPDIEWYSAGTNRFSRTFSGAERLIEYFAEVGEADAELVSTLQGILIDESGAVICHHVSATRERKKLEMDFVLRLWIDQGQIVRVVSLAFDQRANDVFWA
jgi:ketosteroid isomerase-like protein